MNEIIEDNDRFDEIESVCALLAIKNCEVYLRKMPLQSEDQDGSLFKQFSKLIQAISMWPTTFGPEKCTISQVIIEYNKNFNLAASNVIGYFNDACSQNNTPM